MSTHDQDPFAGSHNEALREVLAAAAGPASPSELAGEAAAMAAFRAARPCPAPAATRRRPAMKPKLAAVFTAKAAAVALVATSMGGVALAATGNVPDPLPGGKSAAERLADKTDRDAEKVADAAARDLEDADKDAKGADKADDKAAREAAKVAEAHGFTGLCTAFLAHSPDSKGKWMDSTAFTRLRTAAAAASEQLDLDAVDLTAYCTAMLDAADEQPAQEPAAEAVTEDDALGKAGLPHGKSDDATHGKAGQNGKGAENGKAGDATHGKSATAPDNGQGDARSAAGADNGSGNGAAGEHGKSGDALPAAAG